MAAALASCTPGDATDPGTPVDQVGSLVISIGGLPDGVAAQVAVNGPAGFFRAVAASATLAGLAPGAYTITIANVTHEQSVYSASPGNQVVLVPAGGTASAAPVAYALATGFLTVSFAGLPGTAAAEIVITGPAGYSRTVAQPLTIAGLVPGTYVLEARQVHAGNSTWAAATPTVSVQVTASATPAAASFAYALSSGALTVTIAGLPSGATPSVRLSGPADYAAVLTSSSTITNMTPGTYTVTPDPVIVSSDTWRAPGPFTVEVPVGEVPVATSVTYALATGRLTLMASGPVVAVTQATFHVSGPGGYAATASSGATLAGLVPGAYTVTANSVNTGTATYVATPASQTANVTASATPTAASATWALATGSLFVGLTGLPGGVNPNVLVAGPNGFSATVETSTTLHNLAPGSYTITAASVNSGVHVYAPSPAQRVVSVQASLTATQAPVVYALNSALLSIAVTGLPNGVPAAITVTGPGGFQQAVTGSVTLSGLVPGLYQISAVVVTTGGAFVPTPAFQSLTLNPSVTIVNASVAYAPAVNSLTVTISGLPAGVPASVSVTGPGGFAAMVTASQTLSGIPAGSYTITAATVGESCSAYTPSPASQGVTVGPADNVNASVAYSGGAGGMLNLCVENVHITQAVQTYAGAVPLVAGRNGLVRVFVKANQANAAQPAVRVRFYQGLTLVHTLTIPAPGSSVPVAVTEGSLSASWNATVSGSLLQPGLSILADVDPANTIAESSDADNSFPANGTPAPLTIQSASTLNIRLIPVIQANGDTGRITASNTAAFIDPMQRMFPVAAIDADLHAPYVSTTPQLQSGGGNWSTMLNEINMLRVAEGSNRYYYGVVRTGYSSGVAGMGYIGLPASIGWDYPASGPGVMAHELGHNFGRYHAPCGGPQGVDPQWPTATHPNAQIGHYGYDLVAGVLKGPTTNVDLMSYCDPEWISDYTYKAILTYRQSNPMIASRVSSAAGRGLLVWGRIERGTLVLEPAFDVDAPPSLPARTGPNRLEAFGPAGESLFSFSFAADPIADAPDPEAQTFAFVIPASMWRGIDPARLRLSAQGRTVERRSTGAASPARIERTTPGRLRVSWASRPGEAALVRNARTGQVVALVRGGSVDLRDSGDDLDVTVSNGVRNVRGRLRPR